MQGDDTARATVSVGRLAYLIFLCRVPLIVSLMLGLALFDFMIEGVFREAFRHVLFGYIEQLFLIAIALGLASFAQRYTAELMIARFAPVLADEGSIAGFVYRMMPRALALFPALAASYPLFLLTQDIAALSIGDSDAQAETRRLVAAAASVVFLFIGIAVAAAPRFTPRMLEEGRSRIPSLIGILLVFAAVLTPVFFDLRNVALPQALGPVAIILLWTFVAVMLFYPLTLAASAWRLPLMTALLVYAVGLSFFDLNDNHEVRRPDADPAVSAAGTLAPQTLSALASIKISSFDEWLKARPDLLEYDHYPVFIVATEGGGTRAGYMTASLLAKFQEICPSFAEHTYFISSVSGGSLGAAAFTGLVANESPTPAETLALSLVSTTAETTADEPIADRRPAQSCRFFAGRSSEQLLAARRILSADLFSPLLAATLFPDSLQRILPVPINAFDRARAVEYALEESWRAANSCGPGEDEQCLVRRQRFSAPMAALPSGPHAATPYFLPNITEVETGYPEVLRSVFLNGLRIKEEACNQTDAVELLSCIRESDRTGRLSMEVPLSTAAVLSNRFPFLLPAGQVCWPSEPDERRVDCPAWTEDVTVMRRRYVDGGYFEASGSWFAARLARALLESKFAPPEEDIDERVRVAMRNVQIVVLVLQSTPTSERPNVSQIGLNEVMSPVRALLNTRRTRADVSKLDLGESRDAIALACGGAGSCTPIAGSYLARSAAQREAAQRDAIYPLSVLAFQLYDGPETGKAKPDTIPFSLLLSERSQRLIDLAVDFVGTRESWSIDWNETSNTAPPSLAGRYAVLGDAKHLFCLLHMRKGVLAKEGDVCFVPEKKPEPARPTPDTTVTPPPVVPRPPPPVVPRPPQPEPDAPPPEERCCEPEPSPE